MHRESVVDSQAGCRPVQNLFDANLVRLGGHCVVIRSCWELLAESMRVFVCGMSDAMKVFVCGM